MAIVQGIKEKVHLPIYDSLAVDGEEQVRDKETTSILKFFVNVQNKTKLETNLQSASLLPHYNTFEARAMRVVISDLPPEFPGETNKNKITVELKGTAQVTGARDSLITDVQRAMDLLEELRDETAPPSVSIEVDAQGNEIDPPTGTPNTLIDFTEDDVIFSLEDDKRGPSKEQITPNNGSGTIIGKIIYNTVTTLYVGEKIMIQMPTWFFPAGAGPYSESGNFTTHGEPSPTATFRFAEPIFIDKQQNFRVELEVPDTDTLKEIQKIYGPFNIWVVLDGYMTRDVQ
jgi:hypothetical protein